MKTIDVGLKTTEDENNADMGFVDNPDEIVIQKPPKRSRNSFNGKSHDFTREKHMRNLA